MSSGPEREGGPGSDPDVLVLGASFAGIEVVEQLRRRAAKPLSITVVDRQRSHGYIPLVHERLCGVLPLESTALPTARFVDSIPRARLVQDEVVSFDPGRKEVTLGSGATIRARFVVVALGSELAPPRGLPGAEHLRSHKLAEPLEASRQRLHAVLEGDGEEPPVVVVGGGISGVELAGELALLARRRPSGWRAPRVTLVSASARLLPELADGVGRAAERALRQQGVALRLRTRLLEATADAVLLQSGDDAPHRVPSALTFWTGGIRPAPVLSALQLPLDADGWLTVGPTLQCFPTATPTVPEVFACGDAVRVQGGEGTWPTMQRAIECIWQAGVVARNIITLFAERPDYPRGVPPLRPHVLRRRFFYGVSLGERSLLVYGAARVDLPRINRWFRRWLMRQYFARYAPRSG